MNSDIQILRLLNTFNALAVDYHCAKRDNKAYETERLKGIAETIKPYFKATSIAGLQIRYVLNRIKLEAQSATGLPKV